MLFNLTNRELIIGGAGMAVGAAAVGTTAVIVHGSNKKRIESVTGMSYKDIISKGKINALQTKLGNASGKTAEFYQKKINKLEATLSKVAEAVAEPVAEPETCNSPALV